MQFNLTWKLEAATEQSLDNAYKSYNGQFNFVRSSQFHLQVLISFYGFHNESTKSGGLCLTVKTKI